MSNYNPEILAWLACSDSYKMPTSNVEEIKEYIRGMPSYAIPWAKAEEGNSLDKQQQAFMTEITRNIDYEDIYELVRWFNMEY